MSQKVEPKSVAAVVTVYGPGSHADVIIKKNEAAKSGDRTNDLELLCNRHHCTLNKSLVTQFKDRTDPRPTNLAYLLTGIEQMMHTNRPVYPAA